MNIHRNRCWFFFGLLWCNNITLSSLFSFDMRFAAFLSLSLCGVFFRALKFSVFKAPTYDSPHVNSEKNSNGNLQIHSQWYPFPRRNPNKCKCFRRKHKVYPRTVVILSLHTYVCRRISFKNISKQYVRKRFKVKFLYGELRTETISVGATHLCLCVDV